MKPSSKLAMSVVAILLLALPLLAACGDDETPAIELTPTTTPPAEPTPTAEPMPAATPTVVPEPTPTEPQNPTWVYNVNYEDEDTVWTVTVTGEETVDGVDCYVTEASYDANPIRYSDGRSIGVKSDKIWRSKSTLEEQRQEQGILAMGTIELTSIATIAYSGDSHGAPFSEGKTWSLDRLRSLDPPLSPDVTTTYNVKVVALENVMVPAGTFSCYKVEHTGVAVDGVEVEAVAVNKAEWWSADDDFLGPVKVENYTSYDSTETKVLASYGDDESVVDETVDNGMSLPGDGEDGDSLRITKGPYLQHVEKTAITIMWETSQEATSQVDHGVLVGHKIQQIREVVSQELTKIHEITLTGLDEYTVYHYTVTSQIPSEQEEVTSEDAEFRTAPDEDTPFSFGVYGDSRSGFDVEDESRERHQRIAKAIDARRPDFVVNTGDVCLVGEEYEYWGLDLFEPAKELMKDTPYYIAIGNHEGNAHWYYDFFSYPGRENYYSFDYGNAHFTILDSNPPDALKPGNAQYEWMKHNLQSSDATWKFVAFHHPPYITLPDSVPQSLAAEVLTLQESLAPVFEEYNVDMVFNGHHHLYERTYPIKGGTIDFQGGVIYITTGGGGAELSRFAMEKKSDYIAEGVDDTWSYCLVRIIGDSLEMTVYDIDGHLIDSLTITAPQIGYILTMEATGSGTIDPAAGMRVYPEGTPVTITASPDAGWHFVKWSGDAVAEPHSPATTITMNASKRVTANFTNVAHTLTMAVTGSGSTDPAVGDHDYGEGRVVNLSATPDYGWKFDNWTGDVADPDSVTTTVTMDKAKTVTANFSQLPVHTLTMTVTGGGSTDPAVGDHDYPEGEVVDITATPDAGWRFDNWTGDVADPDSVTTTVTMDEAKTVTANFSKVTVQAFPAGGTTWVYDVNYGMEATVGTVAVTGEGKVGTTDCYVTTTTYDVAPSRAHPQSEVVLAEERNWLSKSTLDKEKSESDMLLLGTMGMTAITTTIYTGGTHGAPYLVGQTWTYDDLRHLEPPLTADATENWEAEVVAQENITIPAGTFSCYKIEYRLAGSVVTTEWWSADVLGVVKRVNDTYLDTETRVLVSYTPG